MTLLVHILAGGLGLVFGYVALYAAKGATLHRKAGTIFVYAMLTTSVCGMVIAAVRGVAPGAVLATMLYWLWRVRIRRSLRGIVAVSAPEAI